MNPWVGLSSVIPLVILLILAGLGTISWAVPVGVAAALAVWTLFVGHHSRRCHC